MHSFNFKKFLMLQAVILPALLAVASPEASADIYKYVDANGSIVFTNVPRSNQIKIETVVRERPQAKAAPERPEEQSRTEAAKTTPPDKAKAAEIVKPAAGKNYYVESGALSNVPFSEIIGAKCDKYNVDPSLVKSIIKAESNFNPQAVSPKGARGLMQLMPSTAADMGVRKIFDPEQNIDGGVKYLRYLLNSFNGDVELSVAAYNCGEGKVIRNGMCVPAIPETKDYVRKVMRLSKNPVTGTSYTKAIYKVELKDGSILFTESPVSGNNISLVE
ncbi:MAG: transglycosylase SLT domain-containing protein [Nitrospirota bacterium]